MLKIVISVQISHIFLGVIIVCRHIFIEQVSITMFSGLTTKCQYLRKMMILTARLLAEGGDMDAGRKGEVGAEETRREGVGAEEMRREGAEEGERRREGADPEGTRKEGVDPEGTRKEGVEDGIMIPEPLLVLFPILLSKH